jgi:hypothetical protein
MVEAEMEDYLDHQTAYGFEVQMDGATVVLEMEYLGHLPQYPSAVSCRFFVHSGTGMCRIGDRVVQYRRGVLREVIEGYIGRYVQEHGESEPRRDSQREPLRAADDDVRTRECVELLELKVPYSAQELRAAYYARLKDYHPDYWERERDPQLTAAATEMTQRIQDAYQYLDVRLQRQESA